MAKKRIRPMGDIMLDFEKVIQEMIDDHDLQWGEVLSQTHQYLRSHYPGAQEEYLDGSHPVYFYGPLTNAQRKILRV